MDEANKDRLLTLGEAARRLCLDPEQIHGLLQDGGLRYHSRDEQGRFWFEPATVNRLALARGSVGKGIDDGRPPRRRSPVAMDSVPPPLDDDPCDEEDL